MTHNIYIKSQDCDRKHSEILNDKDTQVTLSVNMSKGENSEKEDLSELIKVFPLADMLVEKGKNVTVDINRCENELKYRILPLIFLQAICIEKNSHIALHYDGRPVLCVAGPYDPNNHPPA